MAFKTACKGTVNVISSDRPMHNSTLKYLMSDQVRLGYPCFFQMKTDYFYLWFLFESNLRFAWLKNNEEINNKNCFQARKLISSST